MDFETLLHVAKKNQLKKPEHVKCLQTKFKPPTKEQRERDKALSEGVARFLARKEEEERKKKKEAERRREQLAALRALDPKANKRIQHMLKRTKSANKSVMNDVDRNNTADTVAGPLQPDDDDYGFVSEASSALYNKVLQKMYSTESNDVRFAPMKKPKSSNLLNTKERVKMALSRQEEEDKMPHKRKRRKRDSGGDDGDDDLKHGVPDRGGDSSKELRDHGKSDKPKPKRPAPPPIDFMELLKIAEKKQHEPIVIEPKKKKEDEPEQLLTKKQKAEQQRLEELRRQKEARARGEVVDIKKIPKIRRKSDESKSQDRSKTVPEKKSDGLTRRGSQESNRPGAVRRHSASERERSSHKAKSSDKKESDTERLKRERDEALRALREKEEAFKLLKEKERLIRERDEALAKLKALEAKESKFKEVDGKDRKADVPKSGREFPPKDVNRLKTSNGSKDLKLESKKDMPPKEVRKSDAIKSSPSKSTGVREFPPKDVRTNGSRPFPPKDVRPAENRSNINRSAIGRPQKAYRDKTGRPLTKEEIIKKKLAELNRRRIEDSDEDYDSEMDDFIDNGPDPTLDETEDVSAVIKQIFKYDKNKYNGYDDDEECKESNWSQIDKEERHSYIIGKLEDKLEEEMEKRAMAIARKKKKS